MQPARETARPAGGRDRRGLPDDRLPEVERVLADKYGVQFQLFGKVESLLQRRGRMTGRRVAVALTVTG